MELTDVQWELLKSLVEPKTPAKRRGRPWKETRAVLEGVLWILRTGAQWAEMPNKFPPYQTCHRRFQRWVGAGVLDELLRQLAEDLLARGQLDLAETFIDASFSGAKKGPCDWSNTPRQRDQDHGNYGWPWSSYRRMH